MAMLFLFAILVLTTAYVIWSFTRLSYRNLPPGPQYALPLVGNMFQVRKLGMAGVVEKFGSVCSIWMGSKLIVLVSGAEEIHDALINQADVFSNRCGLYSNGELSCNFKTVATSSGSLWRTLRRNLMFEVLNSARLTSYKPVRTREFQNLLERFREEARDNAGVVPVLTLVRRSLFNVLITMCFGERVEESVVREIDDIMFERFNQFRPVMADYIPILRLAIVDWRRRRAVQVVQKRTEELLMPYVFKSREAMRKGEIVPGRYVETLLQIQARSEEGSMERLTDENILALCTELINGGTDTTSSTTEWMLARIVNEQEVQRKLVEEMEAVLGEKTIDESDVKNLPYLQAVVKETLRLHAPATNTLPHTVSQAGSKLAGFDIPMNSIILFRIKSVSLDTQIWDDPQVFRPERFLQETTSMDLSGTKKTFIPFGAGKRMCPGMNLAVLELHMLLGLFVQNFEWSNGSSGNVDLTPNSRFLEMLKTPLHAHIRERKSSPTST